MSARLSRWYAHTRAGSPDGSASRGGAPYAVRKAARTAGHPRRAAREALGAHHLVGEEPAEVGSRVTDRDGVEVQEAEAPAHPDELARREVPVAEDRLRAEGLEGLEHGGSGADGRVDPLRHIGPRGRDQLLLAADPIDVLARWHTGEPARGDVRVEGPEGSGGLLQPHGLARDLLRGTGRP